MESLNLHLEHLKFGGGDAKEDQIIESLSGILQALTENKLRTCSLLIESDVLRTLARLLQSDPLCAVKAAQVLAEIAKNEEMKIPCIDAGLVPILIPLLDSRDQEMLLHVGRAIGRICYDNNDLQEQLVRAEVISFLVRIMSDYPDNEPLVRVNLLALSNLADLDAAKEALSKTRIAEHLVHQLHRTNYHEKVEIILEVLQTLAENDTLKLQLVEAGIQEAVAEILKRLQESSKPEDMCSLKAASDLIVSLLLGDESMQQLFAEGKGAIYQNIGIWLTSKHTQLQLTGALAIANFARNDSNCVRMVQLGVVHQLLDLLEHHVENGDVSVQHAALSALRNLAIPVANKVQMLDEGVAKRIQMLLRSDMPPVQFKLLGTLRMLMDGQDPTYLLLAYLLLASWKEPLLRCFIMTGIVVVAFCCSDAAEELGQDLMLLHRLVQWCDSKDHAGVCGEANRLLASLIRHSRSQEVVKAIQEAGAMKHLVCMATSEHAIMQNEALIALAIASAINLEIVKEEFKEASLVQNIHKLLQDESTGPEVKYNSIGLLCSLLNSGDLRQEAEGDEIKETLEKLCGHINENVAKQALMALHILNGEQSLFEQ
uniref:Rap1 GTPase-GDP dissociation stimulator 1 n=1 Tax=Anolis carolinensis TaxID=28377 RepID=H9G5G4_ANOCA|nr:PREDICTED: rap1 GTPase-GDP dissociation stimulator 1 isoform X1 [Anolis carolinensis]|eukprot:XP_008114011.1 PREDICTED: rap1 GTPase-GDP dissociation stimulator 1 isoform X1 [Anolis carolinensis]